MSVNGETRQSNIELLRIFSILGVIILHLNSYGGGLAHSSGMPVNNLLLYVLESCFACAVDTFMIISGYFMANSETRDFWKPIKLIAQVTLFRVLVYIVSIIIGSAEFSIKHLIGSLLPENYFVILYCTVFVLSLYLGFIMDHLTNRGRKQMIICAFVILSVYPTLVDFVSTISGAQLAGLNSLGASGDQNGYTFVNFTLCWMIGAFIRKQKSSIPKRISGLMYVFLSVVGLLYAKTMIAHGASLEMSFSYCSPIVIGEAISVFMLFKEMELGSIRIINMLSKETFAVYLLHAVFLDTVGIKKVASGNPFLLLLHVSGSSIAIYMICWCFGTIYSLFMNIFWRWLKMRIAIPPLTIDKRIR